MCYVAFCSHKRPTLTKSSHLPKLLLHTWTGKVRIFFLSIFGCYMACSQLTSFKTLFSSRTNSYIPPLGLKKGDHEFSPCFSFNMFVFSGKLCFRESVVTLFFKNYLLVTLFCNILAVFYCYKKTLIALFIEKKVC